MRIFFKHTMLISDFLESMEYILCSAVPWYDDGPGSTGS